MKKLALALAVSAIASGSAHAGWTQVSGSLGNWKSWNAASKAPIPWFVTAAGLNLIQADNVGDDITQSQGAINISVTGSATYDDVTGAITSLSLSQVGSYTGWYDTDGDWLADDSMTISGLQWNYAGGMMSQFAGTFSGCSSSSPVCAFTVAAGNTNDHGNGLGQSVFDFQGIAAGFKTLPRLNSTFSGYGTFSYKVWAATAGATAIADLNSLDGGIQNRSINVASMVNSGTVTTNAANTATFSLTFGPQCVEWESDPQLCENPNPDPCPADEDPYGCYEPPIVTPIPASAWLLGSGLIGLAGIKRRKK